MRASWVARSESAKGVVQWSSAIHAHRRLWACHPRMILPEIVEAHTMATVETQNGSSFDPDRYPRVKAIVDSEMDDGHSLADMVGEKIFAAIVRGELPDGTRLKSTELAKKLGSR